MPRDAKPERRPSQRPLRVGEAVRRALVEAFAQGHVRDPDLDGASITVSEVRMSPDLRHATVFVLPLGGGDATAAVKALNRARPFLRGEVARRVELRMAPELRFQADESFDVAGRIETALLRPDIRRDLDPPPKAKPTRKRPPRR